MTLIKYTVHTRVRERTPTRTESGKGPTRGLAKNTSLAPHRVCDRTRRAARGSTKYRQGELLVLPAPVPAAPAIRYRSRRWRRLGWLGWRRDAVELRGVAVTAVTVVTVVTVVKTYLMVSVTLINDSF